MPTFSPARIHRGVPNRIAQGAPLSYLAGLNHQPGPGGLGYLGRLPAKRRRGVVQGARLAGLGAIDPTVFASPIAGPAAPPAPAPPGLPAGYDPNTGLIATGASGATPVVQFGPVPASLATGAPGAAGGLAPGTQLTYTVNYAQDASGAFTSNEAAISGIGGMLAGAGLQVVSVQTPTTFNPFSSNQAVLGLQVTQGGITLQSAKMLADNAVANGIGAQIISSSLTAGAPGIGTWISQNWMWVAAAAVGVLILPRVLGEIL